MYLSKILHILHFNNIFKKGTEQEHKKTYL